MFQNPVQGLRFTDRDLIDSVIASYAIVDYGFVDKVNDDDTIDVVHAKKPMTVNGDTLKELKTKKIEVLTFSCAEMAISFKPKKGDKVLLLGLKDYVKESGDVTEATEMSVFLHYSRETMKALPLSAFSGSAKIRIEADNGTLKVDTNKNIELNGKDKQFVTWAELNDALTTFTTALNAHTHPVTGATPSGTAAPMATAPTAPMTIDISAAKTTKVLTGG